MKKEFRQFIQQHELFSASEKILLAVSGGLDSTSMAHLFKACGFSFGIAHINFGLRGKESDDDELFCLELAEHFGVPFFSAEFDTKKHSLRNKISVQMAARQLRYEWLETIRTENGYSKIATAHHLDDSLETFLLNLARGTGITGLTGIPEKNRSIIRPLLFTTREELERFAVKEKIRYRTDASNAEMYYLRNRIRHKVIPVLRDINPSINKTFASNLRRIREVNEVFHAFLEKEKHQFLSLVKDDTIIQMDALRKAPFASQLLASILLPCGFNEAVLEAILARPASQAGKEYRSTTHRLLVESKGWRLVKRVDVIDDSFPVFIHLSDKKLDMEGNTFNFLKKPVKDIDSLLKKLKKNNKNTVTLDQDKLLFPLYLRHWKAGDAFVPFGMKGRKKLSDFLTDEKIPIIDKEKVLVLCSGSDIAWVVGHRPDVRYCVSSDTKRIFSVTFNGSN